MSLSRPAALFLRAIEVCDVVEPDELFPAERVTWLSLERHELDGLEPVPFHCGTERHDGAGIGADFVEVLVEVGGARLAFWHTCSTCHNVMLATT